MAEEKLEKIKPIKTIIKKTQKVKVLVSVYRVNDKIISAKGIPTTNAWVTHIFPKNKLRPEDLFVLSTHIKNHAPFSTLDSYKPIVEQILNEKVLDVVLPSIRANELLNIATFVHEILNIEIELLS